MFLRNCWYVAAWDHEVTRHEPAAAHPARRARDVLPHRGRARRWRSPTAAATAMRRCRAAGSRATRSNAPITASPTIPSGACIAIPGQAAIPPGARVRSYPVVERYHWIWIWMGDPALADPDKIEDFHWMDDPELALRRRAARAQGQLRAAGREPARPVASLLCPSDHARHREGGADADEGRAAQSRRAGDALGHGQPAAALLPEGRRTSRPDQNVDRWQIIDWTPAAFVRLDVGCALAGTGARDGDRCARHHHAQPQRHHARDRAHDALFLGARRTISAPTRNG